MRVVLGAALLSGISVTAVAAHVELITSSPAAGANLPTAPTNVTITFEGSSVPTTFSVAFSGGDLLLGGFRFQRIG